MARNRWELEESRKKKAAQQLQNNITNMPLFQATQKVTESQPKTQAASKKVTQATGKTPTRVTTSKSSSSSKSSSKSTGIPQNLRASTYDQVAEAQRTKARRRSSGFSSRITPTLRLASRSGGRSLDDQSTQQQDLAQLEANSVAWWFADDEGKKQLKAANDAIRAR